MPRAARIVIPGCPHHVAQRGNNRQDVFFVDDDRRFYLETLREQSERFGLVVTAYCLMSNHVHLVCTPRHADSLAKAVGRTNLYYTRYVNRLHGRVGHLWQDRFFSSSLDEEHFWSALVYVERNPLRAGLVRKPWRYAWSSAAAHCGDRDPTGLLDLSAWAEMLPPGVDWPESLSAPQDKEVVKRLRGWTHRGCPLGSDSFVSKLERKLGRRLRPRPVGRPPKNAPPRSAARKNRN